MLDIEGERLNNVLSHLSVEKYIDTTLLPSYGGDIDAPDEFVQNAMVFDGSAASGLVPLYAKYPELALQDIDTGDIWIISDILDNILDGLFDNGTNNVPPHYTAMLALRTYVTARADKYRENMEPASAAITRFYDEWAKDIDKGITKFTECSDNIASRMVTKEKNPLIEQKKKEELESENNFFVNQLNDSLKKQALKSGITQEQLDWIEEQSTLGIDGNSFVDEILRELIRDGVVTQEMLNKSDGSIMIIKEELGYWWDEYGIYMLCIPDIMIDGIEIPLIGDIIDLFLLGPLWDWILQEIKELVADEVVTACTNWVGGLTGMKGDEAGRYVAAVISAVDDRLEDPELQLDHEDNPFKPSENNFEELDEYMQYLASGEYDEFEALHNTMTMFQLVLMGPDNYSNFVQQYAGTQQTAYRKNAGHVAVSALKVNIRTSNLYQSGTDDNIYVIVYRTLPDGRKYEITTKLLDKSGSNDFESGDNDAYLIELPEIVKLDEIEIALKKTPAFDFLPSMTNDWHCEDISVTPMYSGYEATEPISLGGVLLQGIVPSVNMIFSEALNRQNNVDPESRRATNLQVTIQVKDEQWAGSDSDIYLVAYYGVVPWAKVCLDKAYNNDLERGETETYNIPITWYVNNVRGIPLDELRIEIRHEGRDLAKWKALTYQPCFGDLPLIEEGITRWGKIFENSIWKIDVQRDLKKANYVQYDPIEYEYETALDDGLLFFMDSLDGGEEWMDPESEMWSNTTIRKDIFLRLFKGFTPEIEYTGETEFLLGAPPEFTLDFAGQWNGVSMERRTEVKDFEHKEPVEGSAIIEIIDENDEVVYTTNRLINDEQVSVTIPSNKLNTGIYDVKVTYEPDVVNPLYGRTEELFEDAFRFEIGAPTITKQPENVTAYIGNKVEFTLDVAGGKTPYTYQWQVKAGNGEWTDADHTWSVGYNYKPFIFFVAKDQFTTGYKYRCVITDANGVRVISDEVEVMEAIPLTVTWHPLDATVNIGDSTGAYVAVSGGVEPYTYTWEIQDGSSWREILSTSPKFSGENTNSLLYVPTAVESVTVRCVIKDSIGQTVTSNTATLTAKIAPLSASITPTNVPIDLLGKTAHFTVTATGGQGPYTYNWKTLANIGAKKTWVDVEDSRVNKGQGTNTLSCTPNQVKTYEYYCIVTDSAGNTVQTETVSVIVKPLEVKINDGAEKYTISYIKDESVVLKAKAAGGLGPYTCIWYEIGFDESKLDYDWIPVHTGPSYEVGPWFSHEIRLEVTDATGNTVTISVWVEVIDRIN